jgi:hypothetical protein
MSDLLSHARSDLHELPEHVCGCSPFICPTCNPRRTLLQAMLHMSLRATERKMRMAEIVVLAEHRRKA